MAAAWRPQRPTGTLRFARLRLPPRHIGFRGALSRRWVAGWTFAWLGQNRRLSKGYERLVVPGEALLYAAMGRPMVRRLVHT